jgi:Cu(I)/Ag(I) efflux system membrane fusion protein
LWVKLDAYESDLPWLHYGQKARFTTEAYPGEEFEGQISFIDPIVDEMTRTVGVRLVVSNPDAKLKPEMLVRAVVRAQIATGGRVMDPDLAGKWISPMHPEIVKDGPGTCDVCGMALVKAEELGYVPAEPGQADRPLVIPASAPLITGTRAVVYVEVPDREKPAYEGREVVLGPRAGNFYLVRSGLEAGERVVVRGNFKIDSALQIQAKPSMMLPEEGIHGARQAQEAMKHKAPEGFRAQIRALYDAYTGLAIALAGDDFEAAQGTLPIIETALDDVEGNALPEDDRDPWATGREKMEEALSSMQQAENIEGLRDSLVSMTAGLTQTIQVYGIAEGAPVYVAHCPMAMDNQGADWLQKDTAIRNPYYGSMMLECGEIMERLDKAGVDASHEGHAHE